MPFTTTVPVPYATVSNRVVSGSMGAITAGIALPANPSRKRFYLQVVGSGGPLLVNLGGVASHQAFNLILAPATTDYGSDGGVMSDNEWQGAVGVSGGIGCRFIAWEGY